MAYHCDSERADFSLDTQLLLDEWQKIMDQTRVAWELEKIQVLRQWLMEHLQAFLESLRRLGEDMEALNLDPGIFLDHSKGNLSPQDIAEFARWVNYLKENEGVRVLCESLGRMLQTDDISEDVERIFVKRKQKVLYPDLNTNEEIIGIRLGRDIEYALPNELALLSDPDISLLFDVKFFESRLMCFDMQGLAPLFRHKEIEVEEKAVENDTLGPMIICIDTSGSMAGVPETIAKAVALLMAYKAREQHRPCYLINFSTEIATIDLSETLVDRHLIEFLRMSFHSGTDVAPAISHGLDMIVDGGYERADLLIISDFIIANLPDNVLEKMAYQRTCNNHFYSLVIGSKLMYKRFRTLFDREWAFDPTNSSIYEVDKPIVLFETADSDEA